MTPGDHDLAGRAFDGPTSGSEQERVTTPMPLRPMPPLAKRLNRNALTVAAALAGVTVITVLVVTRPTRNGTTGVAPPSGEAPAPLPARPAFLDQPPKPVPLADSDTARGEIRTGRSLGARTRAATNGLLTAPGMPGGTLDAAAQLPVPPPVGESTSVLPAPGAIASSSHDGQIASVSPRDVAYQSALTSSVLVDERNDRRGQPSASPPSDAEALGPPTTESGPAGIPRAAGVPPVSPATLAPTAPTVMHLDPAGSPYTVRAGTVVAAFLVTGINSDLPGEVLGQTSRDVFDSETQHTLLVPKGSRLIGAYDSRSVGTGRLIVSWTRLILPDGRSMTLPRLAGTDLEGQAGLHDEVDHHYGRVYGAALLTSALTAGVQLSQPQQSGLYAVPSTRQVAAGALGQTMGDVALESARRGLDVAPTVVIRPGQPFDVFLAGDLSFPGPYRAEYAAAP